MTVELVREMKRSHPRCSRHAEGLFVWSGVILLLVVFRFFRSLHLSLSYRLFFPLSTSPSLLSVCRILPMLFSPPQRSRLSPSHSPHAVAVGWSKFLGYGYGGDIWEIVAYWLATEEEEELAGLAGNPPS